MKAIKRLLDECTKQGPDMFGFIHYIPKEYIEDAQKEYDEITQSDRAKQPRYVR